MIMPTIHDGTAAAAATTAPSPCAQLAEEQRQKLMAACAAMAFFETHPCADTARQAIDALRQWDGPIAVRAMLAAIRMLPANKESAVAAFIISLYLEDCGK